MKISIILYVVSFSLLTISTHAFDSSDGYKNLKSYMDVCNYSKIDKADKDKILNKVFSMVSNHDRTQVSRGISNYAAFLKLSNAHQKMKCQGNLAHNKKRVCEGLVRRAKTFYHYDIDLSLDKLESYAVHYRPQIKLALTHCDNPDKVVDDIKSDIRDRANVLEDIENSDFDKALEKMESIADDFSIKLENKRIPFPIRKKDSDNTNSIYDNAVVDNTVCLDKQKDSGNTTITGFLGEMKDKVLSIFNPEKVKSISIK